MILGEQLISELGRRGELGGYFANYGGYQSLHSVKTIDELARFLCTQGFPDVPASCDVAQVADGLRTAASRRAARKLRRMGWTRIGAGLVIAAILSPAGFGLALIVGIVLVFHGVKLCVLSSDRVMRWAAKFWEPPGR